MSYYNSEQAAQLKDIGLYLQQQRLSQSLTLEEVADQTFIRLAVLRSLEKGDIDQLPERVYVQGFIRRYGDLLGLNGEELAHTLRDIPDNLPLSSADPQKKTQAQTQEVASAKPARSQTQTLSPPPPSKPSHTSSMTSYSRGISQYLPIGLGLVVLGIAGTYFLTRRSATETVVPDPPSPVVEVSPSPSPVVEVSPVVAPSPSPVVTPDVPLSLAIQITERSWVQVTTDRTTAYEGILTEGEQKTWTANQEIRLRTGNAGGVKVSVNNDPLEPLGQSGEVKTANFKAETLE